MTYTKMILRGDSGEELSVPLDEVNYQSMPCPHCGKAVKLSLEAASPGVTDYIYRAIEKVRHSTPTLLRRMFR